MNDSATTGAHGCRDHEVLPAIMPGPPSHRCRHVKPGPTKQHRRQHRNRHSPPRLCVRCRVASPRRRFTACSPGLSLPPAAAAAARADASRLTGRDDCMRAVPVPLLTPVTCSATAARRERRMAMAARDTGGGGGISPAPALGAAGAAAAAAAAAGTATARVISRPPRVQPRMTMGLSTSKSTTSSSSSSSPMCSCSHALNSAAAAGSLLPPKPVDARE